MQKKKKRGSADSGSFDFLSESDFFRLLSVIEKERDYVIVRLLYELGCTLKELVNIRVRDVMFGSGAIRISRQHSRNSEERQVAISGAMEAVLRGYLDSVGLFETKLSYVFQTARKTPLTTRRIFQVIAKYCKEAGVSGRPSPQLIKNTHIAHAYLNNVPIGDISSHVGIAKQRLAAIFERISTVRDDSSYLNFFRRLESAEIGIKKGRSKANEKQ